MDTTQIYSVVNSVTAQALGTTISAVDTEGLVSLGNIVLSSSTNTEGWLNTLLQRIGRTIISTRAYRNKLGDMVLNDFEYGAMLQKISFGMPDSESDQMYDIADGGTVDMFKVNKPKVAQKLFYTRAPYQFHISTQRTLLKEAFLSENGMGSFLSGSMEAVRNKLEFTLESLGRLTIANMIAELSEDTGRVYNLVSLYNAATTSTLTAQTALENADFLRFAVAKMNQVAKNFTDYNKGIFNDGTIERFTPFDLQRMKVISEFETKLETVVQYSAFHEKYVQLNAFQELNYWQAQTSPYSIQINRASDGDATTINNVVAILYDRDALGTYRREEDVLTTPVNAAGGYYNTFWHMRELWFNDLSENAVYFTLN